MTADQRPPSFDPRTWGAATPSTEAPVPAQPAKPRRHRRGDRRGPIVALVLLLAGGAGISRFARPGSTPVPAAGAASAAAPAEPTVAASRRSLLIAGLPDLAATLAASGVAAAPAHEAAAAVAKALGQSAGELRLVIDLVGNAPPLALTRLEVTRDDGAGATLSAPIGGTMTVAALPARLATRVKVVRGEMDATSFYNAAVAAGINDSLVDEFAKAFAYEFDFQREVQPGDVFEVAFEEKVNPEGREVGAPVLLYASLTTRAKSAALYRFLAPGDTEAGWYDGNGRSTQRALLRTPVEGARISSQFGMRLHPVLGFMKLHKGTDFAAPVGTAIFAAGDAVVEWAAMKGPNGNLTILRHDNGWETYYLHQSRFMPGVTAGARVRQGQKIGEIGTTGRSTGPHLHYEVHVDHQPVNPLGLDYGSGKTLSSGAMAAFLRERNRIDLARSQAAG